MTADGAPAHQTGQHSPLAHRLGVQRAVIPHVDDLGATHGANQAFLDLARRGLVTCGSVIVPGPAFDEIVGEAGPDADLGVHLTLTSEWAHHRWAPLSTRSPASGLVDGDGYFWRTVDDVARHLVPEAAEAELRAQIERALQAGLSPTHLDAHMAAAMLPALLPAHVRLGEEYGLWPVLPRSIRWAPGPDAYATAVAALDAVGRPVADHCRGTLPVEAGALAPGWAAVVAELPPGVTHLALHATAPGDFAEVAPDHAGWRFREYEWLASRGLAALCARHDVAVLGCRVMQNLWLQSGHSDAVVPTT